MRAGCSAANMPAGGDSAEIKGQTGQDSGRSLACPIRLGPPAGPGGQ